MSDKKMSEMQVLKQFFGYRPEQKGPDFLAEIREMPAEDRAALAEEAAKQLGVVLDK